MALSGPQRPHLVYTTTPRADDGLSAESLAKALELARQIEELLEETRSVAVGPSLGAAAGQGSRVEDARTHSTRMARAMAASLVDELDALVRPSRRTGSS